MKSLSLGNLHSGFDLKVFPNMENTSKHFNSPAKYKNSLEFVQVLCAFVTSSYCGSGITA